MSKYIDAEKLESALALHYAEITIPVLTDEGGVESYIRRNEIHVIQRIIDSLQQEQSEVDLEKEFGDFLEKENAYVDDNGVISYYNGGSFNHTCDIYPIARYFYELGQLEMRHRITNPEYNAKVVEQLKSEYPARKEN